MRNEKEKKKENTIHDTYVTRICEGDVLFHSTRYIPSESQGSHTGLSIAVATCIRLWVSLSLHLLAIKLEEFRQMSLLSFNEIDMKI